MSPVIRNPEWNEAINRSKTRTEKAYRLLADRFFWREYDLQGYMYQILCEEPVLRPYVRKEHRVWYKNKRKQLLILDFGVLDPTKSNRNYPYWPVIEMIQLKFPVEFRTGLTEPDDLKREKAADSFPYYEGRCRTRIRAKIWDDYKKFVKAKNKARNVDDSARCHIMYFDLAENPSYLSNEEIRKDFQDKKRVDPTKIGKWPLEITYVHTHPKPRLM